MKINQTGLMVIKYFEQFRKYPYLCPALVPTIGYGSTYIPPSGVKVKLTNPPITEPTGNSYLLWELGVIERCLSSVIKVQVNSDQFSSLCSLAYNIGLGNFRSSTLLQKLNRGEYMAAGNEFWKWRRGGGKILKGLVRRRKIEELLFFSSLQVIDPQDP